MHLTQGAVFVGQPNETDLSFNGNMCNPSVMAPLDLTLPRLFSRTSWVSRLTDTQAWNPFKVECPWVQQSLKV